ncbi:hypothetical protein L9F63_008399, partial [Diploptera punctata]
SDSIDMSSARIYRERINLKKRLIHCMWKVDKITVFKRHHSNAPIMCTQCFFAKLQSSMCKSPQIRKMYKDEHINTIVIGNENIAWDAFDQDIRGRKTEITSRKLQIPGKALQKKRFITFTVKMSHRKLRHVTYGFIICVTCKGHFYPTKRMIYQTLTDYIHIMVTSFPKMEITDDIDIKHEVSGTEESEGNMETIPKTSFLFLIGSVLEKETSYKFPVLMAVTISSLSTGLVIESTSCLFKFINQLGMFFLLQYFSCSKSLTEKLIKSIRNRKCLLHSNNIMLFGHMFTVCSNVQNLFVNLRSLRKEPA